MAIKNIIAMGIGFSPGGVLFMPTLGFSATSVDPPVVEVTQESNSSKKIYRHAGKKQHSSIYTIQEKANRELVKLYEETPEALKDAHPIEISIPEPVKQPEVVKVSIALPPSKTFVLPPVIPSIEEEIAEPMAAIEPQQVIEQTITLSDEMDDEDAIEAILALIQAGQI